MAEPPSDVPAGGRLVRTDQHRRAPLDAPRRRRDGGELGDRARPGDGRRRRAGRGDHVGRTSTTPSPSRSTASPPRRPTGTGSRPTASARRSAGPGRSPATTRRRSASRRCAAPTTRWRRSASTGPSPSARSTSCSTSATTSTRRTGSRGGRRHDPPHVATTLDDYRRRIAQVRSDPDAQALHLRHPMVTIWDDHDLADNAWRDGAKAHDPAEHGPWPDRVAAAARARQEWLPARLPRRHDPLTTWRSVASATWPSSCSSTPASRGATARRATRGHRTSTTRTGRCSAPSSAAGWPSGWPTTAGPGR